MHPEILRELTAQRSRELQQRAQRAQLARTASRALRALRRSVHLTGADEFVVPPIPDYVDGSFRTTEDQGASQVPAARPAA
jgi:hypothetical protein